MRGFRRMSTSVWAIVGLQMIQVAAQISISVPNCTFDVFHWTFNKEGQSPCTLAATLQSLCFGNKWQIDQIMPHSQYSGPQTPGQSNNCQCSTVTFSLAAACGACQGGADASWSGWSLNCSDTDITIAGYPRQIPDTTPIPAWAYLNVTAMGDLWDETAARSTSMTNSSEITGGPPAAPTASTPSRKSKAGPIAGGVVGGVVGLVALAFAGFIFYRRVYRPKHNTTHHVNEKVDIAGAGYVDPRQANEYHGQVWTPITTNTDVPTLYNPADPTTFPPSPFTNSHSGHGPQQISYSPTQAPVQTVYAPGAPFGAQGSRPDVAKAVGYQGAPEV